MSEYLTTTQSTCKVCRRLIPARVMLETDGVWFHKECPAHGPQSARVYGDADLYRRLPRFQRKASLPKSFATQNRGCPDSCGLCPDHEQHVCLPILEITDHCNLECPICLVTNRASFHRTRAEVELMLDSLIQSEGQIDVLNLSGGEPTLHPHFREIVEACLARREILRLSVSTNGLILAQDHDLLRFLAERRVIVSLQLDGLEETVSQTLRGRPLVAEKLRLIDACARRDAPMSLTATVVKGVNEDKLRGLVDLLFSRPHILSVMFQPAAYAGQAASLGRPAAAITIPDAVAALDGAGQGTVSPGDFSPLPCSHPGCFSLAFYLQTGTGRYQPIKPMLRPDLYLDILRDRAIFGTDAGNYRQVTDAVYDLWAASPGTLPGSPASRPGMDCAPGSACACQQFLSENALKAVKQLLVAATAGGYSPRRALEAGERSVKSIFIHGFMDPETFDLSRARKCCQVYPQPDGRLIPVCVRNCLNK